MATNSEVGVRARFDNCTKQWKQFPTDVRPGRMDLEASRYWQHGQQYNSSNEWRMWWGLAFTYHSITFSVAGSVTGSSGGTVDLALHNSEGQKVQTTSRSGNGAYSFTWYDDTANVFVEAYESSSKLGRSDNAVAA